MPVNCYSAFTTEMCPSDFKLHALQVTQAYFSQLGTLAEWCVDLGMGTTNKLDYVLNFFLSHSTINMLGWDICDSFIIKNFDFDNERYSYELQKLRGSCLQS